jgi:hypothetical protein
MFSPQIAVLSTTDKISKEAKKDFIRKYYSKRNIKESI